MADKPPSDPDSTAGAPVQVSAGPLFAYRLLRRDSAIKPDQAQELAVEKLQILHGRLGNYDPADAKRKSLLDRFRRHREDPTPQGLYLYGGVGRGKSMLMDLFFEHAIVGLKRRVHFHEFMLEIHRRIHTWRQMSASDRAVEYGDDGIDGEPVQIIARTIAREATLLCFDEFQVTDVADAMILSQLFGELMENGVVIVLTSNRPPEDLYLNGINRELFLPFIDLMVERLDLLHLTGPTDYRLDRLQGVTVYHTPLGPDSTAALESAFRRLTGRETGEPAEILVQGRVIPVPEAAMGVARFGFADLCATPLGAADYLAVAWNYHSVILSGIPRMGPEERNQARRFTTLIDVLYENNVKLICAAAVEPGELYPQGDGSFEFSRTASRLMEMQSAQYLAAGHAV